MSSPYDSIPAKTIAAQFGRAAESYDRAATPHLHIARRLAEHLKTLRISQQLPCLTVLEVGCGTGCLTLEVLPILQAYTAKTEQALSYIATDIATEMLAIAKQKITDAGFRNLADFPFLPWDGGSKHMPACFDNSPQRFNLIICSMALQWIPNPLQTVCRWQSWLAPKGVMLLAVPTELSFAGLRQCFATHGIASPLQPLLPQDFYDEGLLESEFVEIPCQSPRDFLQHLKKRRLKPIPL